MKDLFGVIGAFLILFVGLGTCKLAAQVNPSAGTSQEVKVKKHTVLAQYEPNMVVPAQERIQLKKDRLATIQERREIIDTLNISERKRRQLLKELYRSPFSYKWDKVLANIQPTEDEEEDY